uniref:Mediator of RNA polymerase II transcription subunit 6 n=1 Tax=Rhabditophanes sp. KR3021 TaxID=114890 RepID=A0AC35TUT2_9BILA
MQNPNNAQPPKNLLEQMFKDPQLPPNYLNESNVLRYFCQPSNCFYDRTSCNAMLLMQHNHPSMEDVSIFDKLSTMVGVQYILVDHSPPLFLICKHYRASINEFTPQAYYYILNGACYQCPDLYTMVQSRLIGAIDPLRNALNEIMDMSQFNVTKGYSWEFKNKKDSGEADKDEEYEDPLQARSTNFQSKRTEQLLNMLFNKFPMIIPAPVVPALPAEAQPKPVLNNEDGMNVEPMS